MASFSLKPTEPPWVRPLSWPACWLLASLAALATLPWLGQVPGLHADEAWVGLRAQQIVQHHALSWFGMNSHTGPLHQLLVAGSFAVWGPSVWALRCVGVATNLMAVVLYAWVTGQLLGRRTAVLATCLLVTSPFFLINARMATEHAALSAPLALAAVACLLQGRRPVRLKTARDPLSTASPSDHQAQRRYALAAGVLLGLGTWNHLVFAAVPATLLLLALGHWGTGVWHRTEVVWATFGWACVEAGPLSQIGGQLRVQGGSSGVLARLAYLPRLLAEVWQGDVVAMRVAGEVSVGGWPWAAGLLALACVGLAASATDLGGGAQRARWVALTGVSLSVATAVLVPFHAERHLLLPLWVLPWVLCEGLGSLMRLVGRSGRSLATALCLLACVAQLGSSTLNLLLPLAHYGVVARAYHFGPQLETSNHVADTRGLYGALVARGITQVRAHHFIAAPLRFYDLGHNRLAVGELPVGTEKAAAVLARDAERNTAPLLTYEIDWQHMGEQLAVAQAANAAGAGQQGGGGPAPRDLQAAAQVAALGSFALVQWPTLPLAASDRTPGPP